MRNIGTTRCLTTLILLGKNRKYTDTVASGRAFPSLVELVKMITTFLLAALGWILFRADSIEDAWEYIKLMFTHFFEGTPWISSPMDGWILTISITLLIVVEWLNRNEAHEFARQPRQRWLRWSGYIAILFMIGAYMTTNEMPFIYFQF